MSNGDNPELEPLIRRCRCGTSRTLLAETKPQIGEFFNGDNSFEVRIRCQDCGEVGPYADDEFLALSEWNNMYNIEAPRQREPEKTTDQAIKCAFCGKTNEEVAPKIMIQSEGGVCICNDCVFSCVSVIIQEASRKSEAKQ